MAFTLSIDDLVQLIETPKEHASAALDRLGGTSGVAKGLGVRLDYGLDTTSADDLAARQAKYGKNYVTPAEPKSFLELMWDAFQDVTIIVLTVAGIFSFILGLTVDSHKDTGWIEGATILVAVLLVTMVTAGNDYKKEQQFRALNAVKEDEMIKVIRDGQPKEVSKFNILVGDIVRVELGDILPADGLVFDEKDLRVDESAMTGESVLLAKHASDKPFLLSGTKVMEGLGKMLVVCVGEHSQSGIISKLISSGQSKAAKTTAANAEAAPNGTIRSGPASSVGDSAALGNVQQSANGAEEIYVNVDTPAVAADGSASYTDEEIIVSPLQGKLNRLTIWIGKAGTFVALLVFLVMSIRFSVDTFTVDDKEWESKYVSEYLDFFIVAITVLVVAIPEGLPLAVTISLAYSVKKMLKDNNLVRHLDACETMGSATTICSDKTGTLTTNRMTVINTWIGGSEYAPRPDDLNPESQLIFTHSICLNSTAEILPPKQDGALPEHTGNKTECALLQLCRDMGATEYGKVRSSAEIVKMITFSSKKKRMSVVVRYPHTFRVYTKGATEIVLDLCNQVLTSSGGINPLTSKDRAEIGVTVIEEYAQKGLRTLCLSYRDIDLSTDIDTLSDDEMESNLTCVAIVGIEDPVRPEVPGAIEQCKRAGIVVRMVTGDNITTARSIAKKCGILKAGDGGMIVMEGKEFRERVLNADGTINQTEFDQIWPMLRVLARSSPKDKHTLVTGIIQSNLEQYGPQVVAVTGDGTNDAPALKRADVGFAMGICGTAVAKDASDIILMDDNFVSIVNAVKWGRNVYDSIAKFLQFQLTVNLVAITVAVVGAIFLNESPLTAVQLLWVNLIMDTFASLALATEEPTPALLERRPYPRNKALLSKKMMKHIVGQGIFQLVILLVLVFAGDEIFDIQSGRKNDLDTDVRETTQHYTIVFNTFVFLQLFNEINARKIHDEFNIFSGLLTNHTFILIAIFQIACQVVIVEVGGLAFGTHSLTVEQWFACIGMGAISLPVGAILRLYHTADDEITIESEAEQAEVERSRILTGKELWMRGFTRLRAHMRVVNAFKQGISSRPMRRFLSIEKA